MKYKIIQASQPGIPLNKLTEEGFYTLKESPDTLFYIVPSMMVLLNYKWATKFTTYHASDSSMMIPFKGKIEITIES